jgi:hypothetical protein
MHRRRDPDGALNLHIAGSTMTIAKATAVPATRGSRRSRLSNISGAWPKIQVAWSKCARFTRFFFVPGMEHCRGGPAALDSFDLLGAVANWVEHGKAPDMSSPPATLSRA